MTSIDETPPASESNVTTAALCGAVSGIGADYPCQLPEGHNSPHENNDQGCKMTWELRYVADLRREVEDLRRQLEWLREDQAT